MNSRILEVCVFCFALALNATAQMPAIISQPQSATNNVASAADFSVVATNAASYQWYFQGTSLPGETNATLSLDDLSTNQAGSYTVVVSNSSSSVTSAPAVLTVVPGTILQWTISTFPGGGGSNFLVQLFDHDKPATVENFIHYIAAGAYSNVFIDRDAPNDVIQGGDFVTGDRSSADRDIIPLVPGTNFPAQVDNEFNVGPVVHNYFGTLAMGTLSGKTNSATSTFFFNLSNNARFYDGHPYGPYTVFGRILYGTNNGSNVLQYFNTLSPPTNGIYDIDTNAGLETLPVNYDGTNAATDASLFYCDIAFVSPTNPPVDTSPPTVSITMPAPGAMFTNTNTLTVTGTAQDNVAVASVFCVLTGLAGADGNIPQTNFATGTTNWTLSLTNLEPGVYQLTAYAQDGAGNQSAPATQYLTNAANLPPGLAITYPPAGAILSPTNPVLTITGTLPSSTTVTQVTVQLYSPTNAVSAALAAVISGTNWSLAFTNLGNGFYTIVVLAEDSVGEEGLASESFSEQAPPSIVTQPTNVVILAGSTAEFSVTASNALSYQWQSDGVNIAGATNSTLVLTNVSTNLSGTTYQVFIGGAFGTATSAPVVLTVVTGTMVQITISGFPGGYSSNVLVELFDKEKPATVANFLHYITPAEEVISLDFEGTTFSSYYTNVAFRNMIWDRCIPGFILQGGDYAAANQTNGTPPPDLASTLTSIYGQFTENDYYQPRFAAQVDNEFNAGPVIHNTFGTLAMAKVSGDPDSAANGFFFNLADNSTNLDNQDGGFTVFGRVVSGSNVLQYFNTLGKPNQGIFDSTTVSTNQALANLPVNYKGWVEPANSNLFFAQFTLLSTFNADTNPPTVAINFPTKGQTLTNGDLVMQGTASDNVAVANVACFCRGTNYSNSVYAVGTTHWTADLGVLPPGPYTNFVIAQDGAGNFIETTNFVTVPAFPFVASRNGNGTLSPNLTSNNVTIGNEYEITATAARGSMFANWTSGTNTIIDPTLTFIEENGLQITANFISNFVGGGVSIMSPTLGEQLTNTTLSIKGRVSASLSPTQVTCQVFSATTGFAVTSNMVVTPVNNIWSTPQVSLAPGDYIAQAIARSASGRASLINQDFLITTPLTVIIYGSGHASISNGTYLKVNVQYTEGAEPAAGQSFFSWNTNGGAFASPSFPFVMSQGLTLTLTLVPNSSSGKLTITSPTSNFQVTNSSLVLGGKIVPPLVATQVVCQVFENNAPLTGYELASISGNNWTLPVSNLTMGIYHIVAVATDSSGGSKLASEQFAVNYYARLAGGYKGLFFDPADVSPTSAGYLSFRVTADSPVTTGYYGIASGSLVSPLKSYPFSVLLDNTGSATVTPTGFGAELALSFDVTNFSGQVTGSVAPGGEKVPLTAYRSLTKLSAESVPSPGHYVLSLMPATATNGTLDGPPGDGYATVNVSASGNLAVAGALADDSSFSQSTGVFTNGTNGVWPLYASFYKGHGILLGWETNLPSGESTGTLYWVKTTNSGLYYPAGVNETNISIGTNYIRPAAGVPYRIIFGGGTLSPPVTNEFSFSASGVMVTTNKFKGALVLSTGALKGSVVNPTTGKTLDFSGVFLSPSLGGGGFTLDADAQTGYFEITTNSGQ